MKKYNLYIPIFLSILLLLGGCKNIKLEDADKKFSEGKYYEASTMYQHIYRKTSPKKRELRGEVAFRLAESYRLINYTPRARAAYANAVRYNTLDSTVHLQYARTLHKSGAYKLAGEQYTIFLKSFPDNQFAKNGLKGIQLAQEWKDEPTAYEIQRMTAWESAKSGEFSPALLPADYEQVYFTSNRKGVVGDTISPISGVRNNDLFMVRKDESGNWMKPEHVESSVNTEADEGVVSFNAKGDKMYYTYAPADSVSSAPSVIYLSNRTGGSWSDGHPIVINKYDTINVYAHPAIDNSERYLYFVSDMPGGYGGKDIWRASMIGDDVEYIQNLGADINTAGDEMFPYMRNDSTLHFSSDGHIGMGGLDILKAVYDSSKKGWNVENMKSPINSFADDFGISFEGKKEKGFFSSNRNDGRGYDHIYSFVLPQTTTKAEGYIVDTDDEFITNATIRLVGKDGTNMKIFGKNNGTYEVDLEKGIDYVLLASSKDHLNTRKQLRTQKIKGDSIYLVDFVLTPINKPVVLENIFFDFDKATLRPESKEGLDELVDLLKNNPNVAIELSAHTDRKGTDEYNNRLSQRRAESVVNYLITNGIDTDRLTAIGKGKTEPKTVTKAVIKAFDFLLEGEILTPEYIETLPVEQQSIADQVNRRIEFKVSSITYNLE